MSTSSGHRIAALVAVAALALLAGCGGGSNTTVAGGGSTGSGSGSGSGGSTNNVAPILVDSGPSGVGAVNTAYVSITICAPGSTTNCQTIDHIQVDTGSYGVRIISPNVLSTSLAAALPQVQDPAGNPIAECTVFADGFSWGPIKSADVSIAGESAAGLPIQVIGDPAFSAIPSACSGTGHAENTVALFGANGIIGLGPFVQDCADCTQNASNGFYYVCAPNGTNCSQTTVTTNQEVANPVYFFATDNNGVIIQLPAIATTGATDVPGSLIFGIDTQSNNALGSATVLTGRDTATDQSGNITVTLNGLTFANSFIDSGSNLFYFADSTLGTCTINSFSFFCPSSTQSLSATAQGANGVMATVSFSIGNANTLFNNNPTATAFNNIGAPNSDTTSFDFGLPFFYGRNVYTAIEGRNTSGGMGPYFAF